MLIAVKNDADMQYSITEEEGTDKVLFHNCKIEDVKRLAIVKNSFLQSKILHVEHDTRPKVRQDYLAEDKIVPAILSVVLFLSKSTDYNLQKSCDSRVTKMRAVISSQQVVYHPPVAKNQLTVGSCLNHHYERKNNFNHGDGNIIIKKRCDTTSNTNI